MIWAGVMVAAAVVAVLGIVLAGQTGVLGPLLSAADTLDSELKAEKLAREARLELETGRSKREPGQS